MLLLKTGGPANLKGRQSVLNFGIGVQTKIPGNPEEQRDFQFGWRSRNRPPWNAHPSNLDQGGRFENAILWAKIPHSPQIQFGG